MQKKRGRTTATISFRVSLDEKRAFEKMMILENESKGKFLRKKLQQVIEPMGLIQQVNNI